MEMAAATKVLSCCLVLLCLLSVHLCSGIAEAASLCNSVKVDKSEAGQWRNEVQGLLNRQTFFLYKDNKCHASGTHGNSTNATKMCEKQVDTLKDGADIFKGMLLQMWEEIHTIRESLILQAEMCCQYEEEKRFRGSWVFHLNGKNMFHVDTSTGNWTELDRRFKTMMDMCKKDRDIAAFLYKTSQGDCRTWLDELKSHRKEYPESTGSTIKPSDITQPTSATQTPPTGNSTQPLRSPWNETMLVVILVPSIVFVLMWLLYT